MRARKPTPVPPAPLFVDWCPCELPGLPLLQCRPEPALARNPPSLTSARIETRARAACRSEEFQFTVNEAKPRFVVMMCERLEVDFVRTQLGDCSMCPRWQAGELLPQGLVAAVLSRLVAGVGAGLGATMPLVRREQTR